MNLKLHDPRRKKANPLFDLMNVEPDDVPVLLSGDSSSSSTSTAKTPPTTPATSRTELTYPRPRPPRRHTDKPILKRQLSIPLPPPLTLSASQAFQSPGLGPASDPYTERSYLFQSLQGQDEQAWTLFQRWSSAEERLLEGCPGAGEARKIRKEMRLIKSKMAENSQQERMTLNRLADLYVLIRDREMKELVQQQRVSALIAQQQQQQQQQQAFVAPSYPYYQAPVLPPLETTGQDMTTLSPPGPVPETLDETLDELPPPPPPPSAVSFSNSSLSPLSPSFTPGASFPEDLFWSLGHLTGDSGDDGDGDLRFRELAIEADDEPERRGRGPLLANQLSERASSLPGLCSYAQKKDRRPSVPPVRVSRADAHSDGEEVFADETDLAAEYDSTT